MSPYYCHRSIGKVFYEQDEQGLWWAFLLCDRGIQKYYGWLLRSYGCKLELGSSRGAHVTWVRRELSLREPLPGRCEEVEFHYAHQVRGDNGRHAWLDVWCPQLHEFRADLGLPPKVRESFHLTIGRL